MKNDADILKDAELLFTNKYINVFYGNEVVFCIANIDFIPEEDFKAVFERIAKEIENRNVKKLVFDKRNLKLFDQPSMVWYHIVWKKQMKEKNNMITHRKLLPNNVDFNKSVEIGKKHIQLTNPDFNFADFDIQYVDSLEDALSK